MVFLKSIHLTTALAAAGGLPKNLKIDDPSSVQAVARTIAAETMAYYPGTATAFGDLPAPYYWWETGALIGAMLDYSHYTRDTTYDDMVTTALLANVGPTFDYMVPAHFGDEGNDDLAFWGFAVLAAAERNFVQPSKTIPSWLQLGENIFNTLINRWNTTACGGGVAWQIFASNPNGMDYKNSVANGGLFQLAARLGRATNNQTYTDWAKKVWDWSVSVNFVDKQFNVYDGASSADHCTKTNFLSFSYTQGIYLYGAAVLANHTGDQVWADRAEGLLDASKSYFSPFSNATDIMWEHACEGVNTCTTDMKSFKGYLSRFMYATTQMMPSLKDKVTQLLHASAAAAVNACTGGLNGTTCGQKWYVGGFDGSVGLGQQMCVLETVHGLLVDQVAPPLRAGEIKDLKEPLPPTPVPTETPSPSPTPTKRSKNAAVGAAAVDLRWLALSVSAGVLVLGCL